MTVMTVQPATPAQARIDGSGERRLWTSALLVAAAWVTLVLQREPLVVLALLFLVSAFELGHQLLTRTMPAWLLMGIFYCWVLATSSLLVLGSQTIAPMFAYMMAGYAG